MSDPRTILEALCTEVETLLGAKESPNSRSAEAGDAAFAVSVIIPARNEGEKVLRTVRSLVHGRSSAFPLEIVVVDDASADRSCERLPEIAREALAVSVVVRRLERWSGIPCARNRGAEAARHPLYLITDANTIYPQNWDVSIRRYFQPDRILAGTIVDEQSGGCGYGLSLELPSLGVTWITTPASFGGCVPVAPCTCTVIGRELFHRLGAYDERLPLYGAAEPEFSVRAWLTGCEIVNVPELLVQHRFRQEKERNEFYESNKRLILGNYVRFACSYLPQDLLQESLSQFTRLMGRRDFDSCMHTLVEEGIWQRREHLKQVLRYDFSWLAQRFELGERAKSLSRTAQSTWIPVASCHDLARTLVVIPTCGQHDLTKTVITDCLREPVKVVVVDNKGDHQRVADEKVIYPRGNLGWLRANNLAIETALCNPEWDRVVLLNNDVRLSPHFFAGIVWAETESRASIVGASYDDWWECQRPEGLAKGQTLEARYYVPQPRNVPTGACDGTAVSIRRDALQRIGLFDAERFGKFGWSAMTDLCYRARAVDLRIIATRAAYVHHIGGGHQTAKRVVGDRYVELAGKEGREGMMAKWGSHWSQLRTIPTQAEVDGRFPPRLVVYTAMIGDYDHLEPPEFNDVDHVCFTDQPQLNVPGWQMRQVQALPAGASYDDRARLARRFKLLPQECLPEYQIWIWQDANLKINRHPAKLAAECLQSADLAAFQHDKRNCVYQEAVACVTRAKDFTDKIYCQVRRYEGERYPPGNGLIWSAMIIRRNTTVVRTFNEAWWAELVAGSRRDQLSFNYVAWRRTMRYATVPREAVFLNPHKQQLSREAALPSVKRKSRSGDLTVLLLNWKRPDNLAKVFESIERQTCRPKIFLWNNGDRLEQPPVDWLIDSSRNKACWPRWTAGAMAETEFVCSLDDDLALADEFVLEDLLSYLRALDQPDRLVGSDGVILDKAMPYEHCHHVKATSATDIAVDVVKGKFLACRCDTLRSIRMASEPEEDDIAISGLAARGRPLYHRVVSLLYNRTISLPESGVGISHRPKHNHFREAARRRYYPY